MTISAWWMMLAAVPVLLLGEVLVRHVKVFSRFSIPVPVVGGLLVALIVLGVNLAGVVEGGLSVATRVSDAWWAWILAPGQGTPMTVFQPLLVAFFTCIGLNASWRLAKQGGIALVIFLAICSVLAVAQNLLGVALAKATGVNPLMGVLCGGVALTGGPGTAMGFSEAFQKAGLQEAPVVGASAATFGLVAGALLGGPLVLGLIRAFSIVPATPGPSPLPPPGADIAAGAGDGYGAAPSGFFGELWDLARRPLALLAHVAVLLVCLKAGAYVAKALTDANYTFPVYMGAMTVGIVVRNVADFLITPSLKVGFDTAVIERLSSVLLSLFLVMAMIALNLAQLAHVAGPMAVILTGQVILMLAFAFFVTYPLMRLARVGAYDAAVLAGGQVGFGLGATSNAVATIVTVTRRFGPSPKALLITTLVGGFLIDVVNAFVTVKFIDLLR